MEKHKLQLLNEVWKNITQMESPEDYISVAEVFIEYIAKNFKEREINIMLADIRKHVMAAKNVEDLAPQLQNILCSVLESVDDFNSVFTMVSIFPPSPLPPPPITLNPQNDI